MSIADVTENAILNLIFNATAWANYADNAAGTPQTAISVGLHSADPGETGTMSTSEIAYTGYLRVSVSRVAGAGGWIASTAGKIQPGANIDFPEGTAGTGTVTHFSTGKTGGGAAAILWSGLFQPNQATGNGIIPRLSQASEITLD